MKKALEWEKIKSKSGTSYHAVSLDEKYDFCIDVDNKPQALIVFNNKIDDMEKAFIEAIEVKSIKEAKQEAENYK